MWFLRNVIWIIVLCLIFWFTYLNWEQRVALLQLPGGMIFRDVHLVVAMFVAFAVGMVAALLANLLHVIQVHAERRRLAREMADMRNELNQLRNLPIEDLAIGEGRESR